ncbi:YkgJ family cysteine cluster protein (plasmid) [Shinella sp. PSBB067]|uniref:YkgJ family cysteine cluster protein n=1 Tax=Shinella sp. PSBB067 TaxID=2715959 RepID=UPI00193C2CD5|nr:YkgJ family cysteine cluster protein [Shinella sp. PSBB067]QRI66717.1 YkgJ family cysteine cluster protein [Shinella sp. PSBB067]
MTTEKRFACTACGMCCYGSVPLTVGEAVSMAGRFPLALSMSPVRPGARGQTIVERIGVSIPITQRKRLLLVATPMSFIPPYMACPALQDDKLCGIHANKPVRCRAMPFYAFKDEDSQADMLVPRKGWLCETGPDAPVVYERRKIADRSDFDQERVALIDQASQLQRHIDLLLQHNPALLAHLLKAAQAPLGGRVAVGFLAFLRYDRTVDLLDFAKRQYPVLEDWISRTDGDSRAVEFNGLYRQALFEIERFVR